MIPGMILNTTIKNIHMYIKWQAYFCILNGKNVLIECKINKQRNVENSSLHWKSIAN